MKRIFVIILGLSLASLIFLAQPAHAVSLKITPLRYQTTLQRGEKQKGYVDVSNPTNETLTLGFEVAGFRQINDTGGVEFYHDDAISAGVS